MSLTDVDQVIDDYVDSLETGRAAAEGWPGWINPPSKVGQAAAVKVLARELAGEAAQRDILSTPPALAWSTPTPRAPGSRT